MRADLAARLRRTMRGEAIAENGVTGVSGVTERAGLRPKPPELRQLRRLRLENGNGEKSAKEGVSSPVTAPLAADLDAIEERAALAADCVPACYLDAWARLQCQRPLSVADAEWRLAINDAGAVSRRLGRGRGGDAMDARASCSTCRATGDRAASCGN